MLRSAKSPLVIVGKGVGYAGAQDEMRAFVEKTNIPFLATPLGKGVVRDDDPRNAGSARSLILGNADVIFLCGARLNWILHFGLPPRFKSDVKIIQLDNDPLEFNTNVKPALPLCGDAKVILG
jgi:2-hydroxyacyl-CoA lyase 1